MNQQASRFIESIAAEMMDSAAVNHSYLAALRDGDLPNVALALQDFAFQYGLYSAKFSHYVSMVITNLTDSKHKQTLLANLAEEQGDTEGVELPSDVLASINGIPHSRLYKRFQLALGVDTEYINAAQPCRASEVWSRKFLELCQTNECVGIGAIGIGTELIVSRIYAQILAGLKAHSNLTMIEHVFFDLHSQCDDAHAAQMLLIAEDLAHNERNRKLIEYGARQAMKLRTAFWDEMLIRAQQVPAANASNTKKIAAYGY